MTTKTWTTHTGMKIRVGNRKVNLALKLIDLRIKDAYKAQQLQLLEKNYFSAAGLDSFIAGLELAFAKVYEEFKEKR